MPHYNIAAMDLAANLAAETRRARLADATNGALQLTSIVTAFLKAKDSLQIENGEYAFHIPEEFREGPLCFEREIFSVLRRLTDLEPYRRGDYIRLRAPPAPAPGARSPWDNWSCLHG